MAVPSLVVHNLPPFTSVDPADLSGLVTVGTGAPILEWKWRVVATQFQGQDLPGQNGDFLNGLATIAAPKFNCLLPGGYTFEVMARNGAGWSAPVIASLVAAAGSLTIDKTGGGGAVDWIGTMLQRGSSRTQIPPLGAASLCDDFNSALAWQRLSGFDDGSSACLEDWSGGVMELRLLANGGAQNEAIVPGPRGRAVPTPAAHVIDFSLPFYISARMQIVSLASGEPAGLYLFQSIGGSEALVGIGSFARPGGKFSLKTYNGVDAAEEFSSTIDFSTDTWHTFEIWRDALNDLYFAVDGETPVAADPVNPPLGLAQPMFWLHTEIGHAGRFFIDAVAALYPMAADAVP